MKTPKDSPTEIGQRVIWRGRNKTGVISKMDDTWVWVTWDDPVDAPQICHVNELAVCGISFKETIEGDS